MGDQLEVMFGNIFIHSHIQIRIMITVLALHYVFWKSEQQVFQQTIELR